MKVHTDRTGTSCQRCAKGVYRETSVMDDISGVLHCVACGHQVRRWSSGEPAPATLPDPQ